MRLSALFAPGKGSLVIYSMMFPCYSSDERPGTEGGQTALRPLAEGPCPSYTAFLGQLDGAAEPATQRVNFAVVAKAHCSASSPSPRSAAGGDCGSCPRPATATPGLPWRDPGRRPNADAERVPPRRRDDPPLLGLGAPLRAHRPRAGSPRYNGTLEPLWNFFDLTPEGPPTDWDENVVHDRFPQLSYRKEREQ